MKSLNETLNFRDQAIFRTSLKTKISTIYELLIMYLVHYFLTIFFVQNEWMTFTSLRKLGYTMILNSLNLFFPLLFSSFLDSCMCFEDHPYSPEVLFPFICLYFFFPLNPFICWSVCLLLSPLFLSGSYLCWWRWYSHIHDQNNWWSKDAQQNTILKASSKYPFTKRGGPIMGKTNRERTQQVINLQRRILGFHERCIMWSLFIIKDFVPFLFWIPLIIYPHQSVF